MKLRIVLAAILFCLSLPLAAQTPDVALKGHDPVSYFTDGRPVKGSAGINYDFDERRYLFSSQKNRDRFAASPDRYTPQFGGVCTTGLALGVKAQADPAIWKIIDGKLYVFSSTQARDKAEQDPSLLAKAQQNWGTTK